MLEKKIKKLSIVKVAPQAYTILVSMVEKIKLVTNIIIVNFIKLEVLPIKPVI